MTDDAHARANAEQVRLLREALTEPEAQPDPAPSASCGSQPADAEGTAHPPLS